MRRDYWSIPLHIIRRELRIWSTVKYRRKKKTVDNSALYQSASEIGIQISDSTTTEEINAAIFKLRQRIRELHEKAIEVRDQHLINLMNLAKELNDTERAAIIEAIRKQEERNRGYGILKYFRGRTIKSQAVNEINIPTPWTTCDCNDTKPLQDPKELYQHTSNRKDISRDPNWITIKTPAEILYYCKIRNQQHFGQAFSEGTPFTKETLKTRFNWNS